MELEQTHFFFFFFFFLLSQELAKCQMLPQEQNPQVFMEESGKLLQKGYLGPELVKTSSTFSLKHSFSR